MIYVLEFMIDFPVFILDCWLTLGTQKCLAKTLQAKLRVVNYYKLLSIHQCNMSYHPQRILTVEPILK